MTLVVVCPGNEGKWKDGDGQITRRPSLSGAPDIRQVFSPDYSGAKDSSYASIYTAEWASHLAAWLLGHSFELV